MREGSLEAPTRHAVPWRQADYYDAEKLDAELRRVFDICHGCRRCFNLCDSFPRLFDLIDDSRTGELDSVESGDFGPVVDACTLCDMCFMTKCPYVPPHEFDLDFPHLMLRARAVENRGKGGKRGQSRKRGQSPLAPFFRRRLAETDRNGRLAARLAPLANWAGARGNRLTRPLMQALAGIHREAELPRFHHPPFADRAAAEPPEVDRDAPAFGRRAVLYATCFVNYNNPGIGTAAQAVLARNGVETEIVYPRCCAMPQLEQGDIARVADHAREVAGAMRPWIEKGYDVIAPVPSCGLMLKFEWPLIVPEDEDVKRLAGASFDICEYVVGIAAKEGLAEGLAPLAGGVTLHLACHARAQNMGPKGAEMLRLIPETEVQVIERCSGHGGSWGVLRENFETALEVGRPVAGRAAEQGAAHLASECPLAGAHILQGMERLEGGPAVPAAAPHPIELLARAYGIRA